ncbi:methyltransferase [Geomonas nitrogeniifigens]|uniref:Methyltransferase n=1 Tax=Geomonas diazotrophica TaxID=2843197 RepID=A0ABX8JRR7_9BACT|nr:methyltransferase [Geomonas nitrogeniifigens]QWV99297.1 methyltransferase [Geomonas nitrogeniifigens]QXE88464.1 methyltransferase [Geomonas nitrogeniifigens]
MKLKEWTPATLLELSGGYWSTCTLHAGVKLNLFTPLASASMSAAELAGTLELDARGLAMLLDALAAMGLLDKQGRHYTATAFSVKFLSRTSPDYLGHIIMHHHHLVGGWSRLDEAVKSGQPVRERVSHEDVESSRESFLMGMFNLAMMIAPKIVPQVDLQGRRRLLDLGGGPGTYAIHFCRQNPQLDAVICDLPTTRTFAEQTVSRFDLSDRIGFVAADFEQDDLPEGFDVAWLSHVLHGIGHDACARVLKKTVSVLEPGGLILIQEFILDDTRDAPVFPALFSLNMLLGTPEGQSYSQGELFDMLEKAGATEVRRLPIELPNGAGVIAGIAP